ncbi:hypothetical protein GC105_08735 [Alkalibaculum sp. M08DMB]|uniref:Uncharacterized protein n=1 Tax=Alkalibaculum sporogenes TaxID=2655001 RepID=A0A6A7K8X8_9FIRM|nr:hypothetical protein [Alkalibaculum sporogenes]MPW25874.1 hypothetical protein [Alkalibaculum sporogenes]
MSNSSKKLVAPIIITLLIIIYMIALFITWSYISQMFLRLLGSLILLVLMGVSIYVLIERIKEIRSGEEDDLSKY